MAHSGHHRVAGGVPAPEATRARRVTIVAVVAALALAAVVTASISWGDAAGDGLRGTAVAGSYITPDRDGTPIRELAGAADGPEFDGQEDLVRAIIADLTTFWSTELPSITSQPFTPLHGALTAMNGAADTGSAPCVASPSDIVGNAFYCPSDDGIVYDATTLVPVVLHRYGVGGLVTTFAHEFGHAVEARITKAGAASGSGTAAVPSLTVEARADCDAGAFVAWVRGGHAPHINLGADMMLQTIGPLVDFSDPATLSRDDPTAHGLAVDRLSWFAEGYGDGGGACARLGEPLRTALGAIPDAGPMTTPRYADRAALLAAAERSVAGFRKASGLSDAAANVAASPTLLDAAEPHGQFAMATVLALAMATGGSTETTHAGACFAGAWVRSVFAHAPRGELGGWPGDADEGLAAVLLAPGASFQSALAYIDGFESGLAAC